MSNTSAKKLVHKSATQLRPQSLADLRRAARRPVDASNQPKVDFAIGGESHRIRKRPASK